MNVQLRKANTRETRRLVVEGTEATFYKRRRHVAFLWCNCRSPTRSPRLRFDIDHVFLRLRHIDDWAVRRSLLDGDFEPDRISDGLRCHLGAMPFGPLVVTRLRLSTSLTLSETSLTPKVVVSKKGITVYLVIMIAAIEANHVAALRVCRRRGALLQQVSIQRKICSVFGPRRKSPICV